jgi:subtilase family serine protease
MVSAICPSCTILLVEAKSNSMADLGAAVNYAASVPGVVAISNSYGGREFSGETSYEVYYNHPGKAVTVSSGDNGYGVEFPAASRYVTAVGGTTLNQLNSTGGRNGTETAWSGAGSGCSAYIPKPSWQTVAGCGNRTVADVAAVADPNTGVWVYYGGGWYVFGGTSVASPIIASVYALAGNTATIAYGSSSYAALAGSLNDITSGSNGSCAGSYLCTAGPGYDGPTGNGTPSRTGAF